MSDWVSNPNIATGVLEGPNKLGFYTFSTPEPLTVEMVKELLEEEE